MLRSVAIHDSVQVYNDEIHFEDKLGFGSRIYGYKQRKEKKDTLNEELEDSTENMDE